MTVTITSKWQTYRTTGYTHQVGDDPRATGGVHLHQVRNGENGPLYRIVESNGKYTSATKATPASEAQVAAAKASNAE